ncbi:MAG: hypothetical protein IPN10_13250 [Saprospiraceae bacterium]|nr:hypothetical protein [Saprospiraceae bacterium]
MIKVVYILIFFSFVSVTSWLEKCNPAKEPYSICGIPEDTIVLNTQAEVDSFQLSLPTGCNCFLGMIKLQGNKINDVSKLSFLRGVGHLEFLQFTSQSELTGFDKLDTVYHSLKISSSRFKEIDGFHNLRYIGEYVVFSRLENTESITGFEKLLSCTNLVVSSNPHLTTLRAFQNLKMVKMSLNFSNNDNLGLIEGFHNLDTINGSLNFRENHTLHNISGFEKLVSADNITIKNNQKMVQVEGFVSFKNGKSLSISDNSSLESIEGFSNLEKIEQFGLFLNNNPKLTSIRGLSDVQKINSTIEIQNNGSLKTCCPLFPAIQKLSADTKVAISNNGSGCLSREEILAGGKCE